MIDFLQSALVFVAFLGPLIFFHELGHFLFAKYFGVKVETFSIGFGPKIFKYKKGDTVYAISAIPLGGYVKMFGDNILERDSLSEEDRSKAFSHKTKWQRFWIVFGGPLANFILTFVLFFFLFWGGQRVPELRVGVLNADSVLYTKGLRSSDLIRTVNGKQVLSFTDIASSGDMTVNTIGVSRGNKDLKLALGIPLEDFMKASTEFPALRAPLFADAKGDVWGLSFNPKEMDEKRTLSSFAYSSSNTVYLIKASKFSEKERVFDYSSVEEVSFSELTYDGLVLFFREKQLYPLDLRVKSIVVPSAAERAGLKAYDIITHLEGQPVYSFFDLRAGIQKAENGKALSLTVLRDSGKEVFSLTPELTTQNKVQSKTIGVFSSALHTNAKLIDMPGKGFIESISLSLVKTWETIVATIVGFKKLIVGDVSLKSLGGPISIAKVASDSLDVSLSLFLKIMALISVNLGIINLFPIPVLDGGHILFIIIETIKRGPISKRAVELSLQFGVMVLFALIGFAIYQDMHRVFS